MSENKTKVLEDEPALLVANTEESHSEDLHRMPDIPLYERYEIATRAFTAGIATATGKIKAKETDRNKFDAEVIAYVNAHWRDYYAQIIAGMDGPDGFYAHQNRLTARPVPAFHVSDCREPRHRSTAPTAPAAP